MHRKATPELVRSPSRCAWLWIACALAAACREEPRALAITRGHDPWMIRATLDGKPRVLILALHADLWVAYDTARAALFRVTQEPINFDGAVYNTHHGPQPTTQGAPALTSNFAEPWHVITRGRDLRPQVSYRGHREDAGHAVLRYTLALDADTPARIEVEERVEVILTNQGSPQLERVFSVRGVPADTAVVMDFNAPRLISSEGVTDRRVQGAETIGRLSLHPNLETRFVVGFVPAADSGSSRNTASAAEPRGQRLIAQADCAACHNPSLRTIGPSYTEIAARYRTNPDTIAGLSAKIREGGSDEWGDLAMTSHPNLDPKDAEVIAEYILTAFDPTDRQGEKTSHRSSSNFRHAADFDPASLRQGVSVEIYEVGHPLDVVPKLGPETTPNAAFVAQGLSFDGARAEFRRADPTPGFIVRAHGYLDAPSSGDFDLSIEHSGPVQLTLDDRSVVFDETAAARAVSGWASATLSKGLHSFELVYASNSEQPFVALRWQLPGASAFVPIATEHLRQLPNPSQTVVAGPKSYQLSPGASGDGIPLTAVHPSFSLRSARPRSWKPKVGGIGFLPNAHLVVSTWDASGAVYEVDGLDEPDPERIRVRKIAQGLQEPLGLKVVDGEIYVLQKHELTKLLDRNGDGTIDDYQTVSNGWGVTSNFHEFAFGLAYRDDYFYATLAQAVEPGGAAVKQQHRDRGKVLKIHKTTGAIDYIASGLRTPNGIGFSAKGELFVTDNEGDWLPANKLVHVKPGAFFGSYAVDAEQLKDQPVTPPVVWLPVRELANSPSQPIALNVGPYRDQLLYGDVTYGGLTRVVVHEAQGIYQGCALPFSQGLEAGINRAAVAPDGSIYVGGIGNPADWGQAGKLWYGLQRLTYTGAPAFELLDLRPSAAGIELTFTEALRAGDGERPEDYRLEQWRYVPSASYGGPKVDPRVVPVREVRISQDRRRVALLTDAIAEGHVLHVRLAHAPIAQSEREIWSTDAYCTVNSLAAVSSPAADFVRSTARPNRLSDAERAAGYQLLFNGESLQGLEAYGGAAPAGWRVHAGVLGTVGDSGSDLITREHFADFELELEWRTAAGGNSGVFYRVVGGPASLWQAGAEMQVLDDALHPDGQLPSHRAGAVYDLYPPRKAVTRPVGEFNQARIVARGSHVEHWLNGHKLVEYDTARPSWKRQLASSKFAGLMNFGSAVSGAIGLQHHGPGVEFRNIKVRRLRDATQAGLDQ